MKIHHLTRIALCLAAMVAVAAFIIIGCTSDHKNDSSSQAQQETFASAQEAEAQIIQAVRAHDRATVQRILGPDGEDVLSSGDEVADKLNREKFLNAYNEKHSLTRNADGSYTIVVGNDNWPMPIPIVQDDATGKWRFDTAAGKDEVLNRRIGQNELDVIQVCHAIVDAENEYVQRDPEGTGLPVYADRIISDEGRRNGLYWKTGDNEEESPLGPLVANAVKEGYGQRKSADDAPRPYHGYFYRLMKEQGPNAPGGAMDYVVKGRLLAGFAIVAYPAEYGNSGIMTFIVNREGIVYQKDCGPDCASIAAAMKAYDPGPDWKRVDPATPSSDQSPMQPAATQTTLR